MSRSLTSSTLLAVVFLAGSSATGCMGRADLSEGGDSLPPDDAGTGSNPDGSPKRGPGDPDCSALPVPDLARVCSDGSSVGGKYVLSNHECVLEFPCPAPGKPTPGGPLPSCTQGALCSQGEGCGTAGSGPDGCSTSCSCAPSGRYQCTVSCSGGGAAAEEAAVAEAAGGGAHGVRPGRLVLSRRGMWRGRRRADGQLLLHRLRVQLDGLLRAARPTARGARGRTPARGEFRTLARVTRCPTSAKSAAT